MELPNLADEVAVSTLFWLVNGADVLGAATELLERLTREAVAEILLATIVEDRVEWCVHGRENVE